VDTGAMMREIVYIVLAPVLAGVAVNRLLRQRDAWLRRALPVVSMLGICVIVAIIVSLSREKLLEVGVKLMVAASALNVAGCLLGYAGARALGFDEAVARTISFQTGLRNGGMASGLAMGVLRSADAALGPAIFGPWMNIFGSSLASFWRGRPVAKRDGAVP
jgi:bile acid:Na+ symporter, BASS family